MSLTESRDASSGRAIFSGGENAVDRSSPIWKPIKVTKAEIDDEIARLASGERSESGRRVSLIVHPESENRSLTPGIRAALEVVLPDEEVTIQVQNSSTIGLVIDGSVNAVIQSQQRTLDLHDVWSVPNLAEQTYRNHTNKPFVKLTFTDAPLLEKLYALSVGIETLPETGMERKRDPMADFVYKMPSGGGAIRTYHAFVDPEVVEQRSILWRWPEVKEFLNKLDKNKPDWRASAIALLWNPSTGRTQGSTNTLAAYMSGGFDPNSKPGAFNMARMHRHTVTAVNYAVAGKWQTIVEDQEIAWNPGDLVITAPAWGRHSNGTCDQEAYTFTIQDYSLHAAMNTSLLQENMSNAPILVGSRRGFAA